MPKQTRRTRSPGVRPRRPRNPRPVKTDDGQDEAALARPARDAPDALTERLQTGPLHAAQRRALARDLGRVHGNRYLQRVMAPAVVEQASAPDRHRAEPALRALRSKGPVIQRSLAGSFPTSLGIFEMGMETKEGALTGGQSGLSGTIKFEPGVGTPYSNKIGLVQVVKLTDAGGADVNPVSLPATTGPHVRTTEDKAAGVEGGFFTDVLHRDPFKNPKSPTEHQPGDALPPYYPFSSAGGQVFGFKRSDEASDIQAAELFDFPGTTSKTANLDFSFETVAKADDAQTVYGAVKWSFGLRAGKVTNETMSVDDSASATFEAALEKHRDFYVHEPVTFYFDFDQDQPMAGETDKIDEFLAYLDRFPDVRLDLTGFADMRGNAAYNRDLALRRAESIAQALIAKGVPADRIDAPKAVGATSKFAPEAKESHFRGNRRVTLTFLHTASILPK